MHPACDCILRVCCRRLRVLMSAPVACSAPSTHTGSVRVANDTSDQPCGQQTRQSLSAYMSLRRLELLADAQQRACAAAEPKPPPHADHQNWHRNHAMDIHTPPHCLKAKIPGGQAVCPPFSRVQSLTASLPCAVVLRLPGVVRHPGASSWDARGRLQKGMTGIRRDGRRQSWWRRQRWWWHNGWI